MRLLLPILLIGLVPDLYGQADSAHVTGYVLDEHSGEPIANAILHLEQGYARGANNVTRATSEANGFFHLLVPAEMPATINVTRFGYHPARLEARPMATGDTLKLTITLRANPITFGGVEVVGEHSHLSESFQVSRSAEIIIRQPGAFEDPLRSLQQMPGVTLRSDWDSQISVRGATPDQTLVVIDGFTFPNPYRLQASFGGGMSLINVGMLRSVSLATSGFSPRFGDRVAGLVAFETKSPLNRIGNEVRLNVFDASLSLAVPLFRQKTGLLLSGRRNYHDGLIELANLGHFAVPRWQDVQLKATHRLARNHLLETLLIGSKEWMALQLGEISAGEIKESAEALFSGIIHRWKPASSLSWENYISHYQGPSRLLYSLENEETVADYQFDERLWAWRSELNWEPTPTSRWIFGFEANWQRQWSDLQFSAENPDSPMVLPENYRGLRRRRRAAVFIDHRFQITDALSFQPGWRFAGQKLDDFLKSEPRVSLIGRTPRLNFRVHVGSYKQSLDWQSLFRREYPMDIRNWQQLPDEQAVLLSGEVSIKLFQHLDFAIGLYYRSIDPLIVPIDESEGAVLELRRNKLEVTPNSELMANRPRLTKGRQSGVELALSHTTPKGHLALRYTHSSSRMRDLDDTAWIEAATDRPHDFSLDLSHRFGGAFELSGLLRYSSGNPYAPIIAVERDYNHQRWPKGSRFIYAARNSHRYPDYLRVDLRGTYRFHVLGINGQLFVEWLNFTNHENIYQYLWAGTEELEDRKLVKHTISTLPRLVTGGVAVRF